MSTRKIIETVETVESDNLVGTIEGVAAHPQDFTECRVSGRKAEGNSGHPHRETSARAARASQADAQRSADRNGLT